MRERRRFDSRQDGDSTSTATITCASIRFHLVAVLAYCYGDGTESTDVLTVEGTEFTFTSTSRGAVKVVPEANYDLADDFSEDNVTLTEPFVRVHVPLLVHPHFFIIRPVTTPLLN